MIWRTMEGGAAMVMFVLMVGMMMLGRRRRGKLCNRTFKVLLRWE
jgi:hypothetical protein